MSLSNYEKETTISFNDDEKTVNIYTCNAKWMRRLDKCCRDYPEKYKLIKSDEDSKTYETDKNLVSFPRTPRASREYTEDEKNILRDRLKRVREMK
jgi:hypothetical protein